MSHESYTCCEHNTAPSEACLIHICTLLFHILVTFTYSLTVNFPVHTHTELVSAQQEASAKASLSRSLSFSSIHAPEGGLLPVVVTTASCPHHTRFPSPLTSDVHVHLVYVCLYEEEHTGSDMSVTGRDVGVGRAQDKWSLLCVLLLLVVPFFSPKLEEVFQEKGS